MRAVKVLLHGDRQEYTRHTQAGATTMVVNPCGWQDGSRRIWSLLDLLRSHAFVYVAIGEMYQKYLLQYAFTDPNALHTSQELSTTMDMFGELLEMCYRQQLEVSATMLHRTMAEFQNNVPIHSLAKQRMDEWFSCFTSELESRLFLLVVPHRTSYFKSSPMDEDVFIGKEVDGLCETMNNFPDAKYDAIEAGNCFAFERFSACVHHLMRCAEFGLVSVAKA